MVISPTFQMRNWGSERVSKLSKGSQLVSSGTKIQTRAV